MVLSSTGNRRDYTTAHSIFFECLYKAQYRGRNYNEKNGFDWGAELGFDRRILSSHNEITQQKRGGVTSAWLILESVKRHEYVDAVVNREDEAAACQIIHDAAISIERGGAEFIVITCNDAHRFVPEVQPQISIPFLHIADATAEAIKALNMKTVALTGIRKTMEGTFYSDILKQHGITTLIPTEEEMTLINDTVFNELVKGEFKQSTRDSYAGIFRNLHSRGAEGIILGCTEIPLLMREGDADVKTFSTTEIHCKAAVKMALEA